MKRTIDYLKNIRSWNWCNVKIFHFEKYDNKKFSVIMSIVIVSVLVDSSFSCADTIIDTTSKFHVLVFIVIAAVYVISQYLILDFIKHNLIPSWMSIQSRKVWLYATKNNLLLQTSYSTWQRRCRSTYPRKHCIFHLCQTDVKSYAIAGSPEPYGLASHKATESLFQNILGNPLFNLDIDGFHGVFQGNNDLQVNLTSQSGGLHSSFRHLGSTSHSSNNSIPSESEVYPNTVHSDRLVFDNKTIVSAETYSRDIQQGVVTLLSTLVILLELIFLDENVPLRKWYC